MSLFQCENCGCVENTSMCFQGFARAGLFDWKGKENLKGGLICSACGPKHFRDKTNSGCGHWHKIFERIFLPKGEFRTRKDGNLEHIKTGSTDFRKFRIKENTNA